MLHRKINKLKKDPKLFFKDMLANFDKKMSKYRPIKTKGFSQYTVVSAVYNVSKYLEQYFTSLTQQNLDFKNHIHLILVDDGSTDNSAEIIKKWEKRFPKNITYIYKENGGQGSARNLGLDHVKTPWVTFIDPDDFVDLNYFLKIDTYINKNPDIALTCCNFIFYYEDKDSYQDTHPLKFRFAHNEKKYTINSLDRHMQLAVNCAIFRNDVIQDHKLRFDERIKPNFEDAHYVNKYLSLVLDKNIGFLSSAKYFYRKRSDNSSTLDTSWSKKGLYSDVLLYGCLDILNVYKLKFNFVPYFIQRTVLYHCFWYFRKLLTNPSVISFLSEEEKESFKYNLNMIFNYIDNDTILKFDLAGCWFFHKIGILNYFDRPLPKTQYAYIDDYDNKKELLQIRYFTNSFETVEYIEVNSKKIDPVFDKKIKHKIMDKLFCVEKKVWIPIGFLAENASIKFIINNSETVLNLKGKQSKFVTKHQIINQFISRSKSPNIWIFMDRDTHADDNAEHLYQYTIDNHPEIDAFFILKKDSVHWEKLENKNFKLIEYGSVKHEKLLIDADKIISSHADQYVEDYFKDGTLKRKSFVFLQHGVTKDDMSKWFNQKRIAQLITASPYEYNSIVSHDSSYKFSKKEVSLTGFPRHDALIHRVKTYSLQKNALLIMPTWRSYLVGDKVGNGNERKKIENFTDTNYAKNWLDFLNHPDLKNLSNTYEINFFLHPNLLIYMDDIILPNYVNLIDPSSIDSIQDLFLDSSALITDYSSVAFDFALTKKAIFYFQFDKDELYNGIHTYQKGYFDYEQHGFGSVSYDVCTLISDIIKSSANKFEMNSDFRSKVDLFLPYTDGNCCERVFEKIKRLDEPFSFKEIDSEIINSQINNYFKIKDWRSITRIYDNIINEMELVFLNQSSIDKIYQALILSNKINSALLIVRNVQVTNVDNSLNVEKSEEASYLFGMIPTCIPEKKYLIELYEKFDSSLINGDLDDALRSLIEIHNLVGESALFYAKNAIYLSKRNQHADAKKYYKLAFPEGLVSAEFLSEYIETLIKTGSKNEINNLIIINIDYICKLRVETFEYCINHLISSGDLISAEYIAKNKDVYNINLVYIYKALGEIEKAYQVLKNNDEKTIPAIYMDSCIDVTALNKDWVLLEKLISIQIQSNKTVSNTVRALLLCNILKNN